MFSGFTFDAATFSVSFVRPDISNAAFKDYTTTLSLTRNLQIGKLSTRVVENAKVCGFSFVDYFMSES